MRPLKPLPRAGWRAVTYAENQAEYRNLPANLAPGSQGEVETRWKLSWRERLLVLLFGELHLYLLTFGHPLAPLLPSAVRAQEDAPREVPPPGPPDYPRSVNHRPVG